MHYSLFVSSALSVGFAGAGLWVAIALLACVLGAEIAGICILVSKMLRAREAKRKDAYLAEDEDRSSIYRDYAVTSVLLLGAIPQASYITLTVLAVLAAIAAVVFVVLLVVFRACGYDFASAAALREKPLPDEEQSVPAESEDETFVASEEALLPDESEEQRQEAYTAEDEENDAQEEEPFAMFAEETEQAYDDGADPADEEETFETADEAVEEDVGESDVSESGALELLPASPVSETTTVTTVCESGPAFADGSQPYKVVEKTVTETVKEIYTETPAPAQPAASSTNDAVLEKLVDLLEYEIRGRHEQENKAKEAEEAQAKNDSVATFARAESPVDDEDEDDEDDDLDTDENDRASGDEDDVDDEENDTEGDHFTGNERIIGFDEATGCYIVARYRKSFEAKLIQARPNIKQYYSELKNALLSYKGTKSRVSWTADSFHNGREQIAKINVKTKILEIYLAIDPATLEGTVYRGRDVGSKKKYSETPFQYKIRTPRKFKWAMELVQRVSEEHGLAPIDIEHVDYEAQYPFDSTENLVERKLIKEYIRQEKPATTFELDPDHIPSVPDEDESVIPANANFSWEFDNERMAEPEPIAEEPAVEPAPVEEAPIEEASVAEEPISEPAPAEAPAAQATIKRETVKVTEVRYTERYYKDAQPTYEQVITTTEPIEAIEAPVMELDASEFSEEETEVSEAEEVVAEENDSWNLPEIFEDMTAEDGEAEEETLDEERFFDDPAQTEAEATEEPLEETVEETDEETSEDVFENEEASDAALAWEDETSAEQTEEDSEAESLEEDYAYENEDNEDNEDNEEASEREDKPAINLNPSVAVVDICAIEAAFPTGAVINLEVLKAHDLVIESATVLKIYASGTLSKAFTVEANQFTLDAIKAIGGADGDTVMVL